MAKDSKDTGVSLLQKSAAAAGMSIFNGKSAVRTSLPGEIARLPRGARPISAPNWPLRISLALLIVAGDLLLIANKDRLLSNFGYESVPSLPLPGALLNADDQALYWTFALYDIGKLRSRFHIEGYYAISRGSARRELERLLPLVAPATLGEISAYSPVAFRSVGSAVRK
jgi:hypothetical protein